MPEVEPKRIAGVDKGHALIGAITGSHVAAILMAGFLAFFTVVPAIAQTSPSGQVYTPCWAKEECLSINSGDTAGVTARAGQGECANGKCWCSGSSCRDPRFRNQTCPTGQGHCYSNPPPVPLVVSIGGSTQALDVGDYISKVYNYGVTIAGILAGVMFVIGGFQYLTAGGDSGKVSKAKDRIRDALVGMLLVFCAFVILNTVNPDVLRMQMPKVPIIRRQLFVACQYFEGQRPCGERFFLERINGVPTDRPISEQFRIATTASAAGGSTECYGMSCSRAGSNDATHRCRRDPRAAAPTGDPPAPSANACTSAPVAPYQCVECIAQGRDCRGVGRNNSCCGGFCMAGAPGAVLGDVGTLAAATGNSVFTGFCSNGNNGLQCGTDAECFSGVCADLTGSNAGGVCVGGVDGSPCDDDEDCLSGRVCVEKTGIHICVTPTYYSPCESSEDCTGGLTCHNSRCGGNMTQSCTTDAECEHLIGAMAQFGPMKCWTQESHNICKPFKNGTVCNVGGQDDCGSTTIPAPGGGTRSVGNICCDRCLTDRAIFSASAGICVTPGPGSGCDNTSECQRYDSASLCRPIELYGLNVFHCSYGGTEGMPCVGGGSTNTCQSGLECPGTVYRCVRPPGCPAT